LSVAIAAIVTIPIAAGSSAASDETASPDTTDQATVATTTPAPSETPASPVVTATAPEPTIGTSIVGDVRLTFTVPDGWENNGWFVVGNWEPTFGAILVRVGNIFSDPCQWVELDPPPGPSVDDLVAAFASVPILDATAATDITVDGFHGKQIEFTVPDYTDDECIEGRFGLFQEPGWTGPGPNYWAQGPFAHHRLWILDVDGTRLVIGGTYFPDTSQQDLDDLDTLLNSIQIEPLFEAEQTGDDDPVASSTEATTSST
jgi:hypothetical protein